MSLDEDVYTNIYELDIDKSQPHRPKETGSCPDRAEAVAGSETTHFRRATVCLGVLCFTLLIAAIGVGAQYIIVYNQLMGSLKNCTQEMEQLQIQNQNLTVERDQINSSYHSVLTELDKAKENMVSCPNGWTKFGCSCYYLSTTSMPWESSKQQCLNGGGYLVVINSEKEMMFLNKFGAKFWIGLSRPSGHWQWTDGRAPVPRFWLNSHPQPYNRQSPCAAFNTFNVGTISTIKSWSSENCFNYQKWVCEQEATVS